MTCTVAAWSACKQWHYNYVILMDWLLICALSGTVCGGQEALLTNYIICLWGRAVGSGYWLKARWCQNVLCRTCKHLTPCIMCIWVGIGYIIQLSSLHRIFVNYIHRRCTPWSGFHFCAWTWKFSQSRNWFSEWKRGLQLSGCDGIMGCT